MHSSIMAVDVDLGRVHAYSRLTGRICFNSPEWPWDAMTQHEVVLVEVASPVDTSRAQDGNGREAQEYNRRKWMIGNAFMVGRLQFWMESRGATCPKIFVSPANLWTLSHKEEMREVIAGCAGQDNHDIRACRCMLHYFGTNPEKWKPLDQFLQGLRKPQAAKPAKARRAATTTP